MVPTVFTARFYGGPLDGQSRNMQGPPPSRIEVPLDDGGPFTYVLTNPRSRESWPEGGGVATYHPDPKAQR